jgi:hypothetical protein
MFMPASPETPEFAQWFGASKVVSPEGKPAVVYHGTNLPFTIFNTRRPAWFAQNPELANQFTAGGRRKMAEKPGKGSSVYPVYLKIENPFDLTSMNPGTMISRVELLKMIGADTSDATLRDLAKQQLDSGYVGLASTITDPIGYMVNAYNEKTRLYQLLDDPQIVSILKASGYDGIATTEDVTVGKKNAPIKISSTTYAVFEPTQVKSATGNVGTFSPTNPDIRFMPSDTDYLSAVNSGDTAAAQRMVDEAANAAGYTVGPVWHGGAKPTVFNVRAGEKTSRHESSALGSFFSDSEETASQYGNTAPYFLRIENPIELSEREQSALDTVAKARLFRMKAKQDGFDGAIIRTQDAPGFKGGTEYVAFDPTQIKSAEPITRNDQGNVIPLSQRFQTSNADIRFMPDYSGEHRAPQRDSGAPLDNLKDVYPEDVYGPKGALYYGHASGDATDKAAIRIIQSARNKPDAPVKVFRAIPKSIQSNEINPGDWITTIKSYAVQHGEGVLGGDYKILEKTVPAGDLYTNGDSIFEFGYDPKFMPMADSSMPGAYSFTGGYRALPGKSKGSLRIYSPAGSLIGIAASLDEAQRIIRKKAKQ